MSWPRPSLLSRPWTNITPSCSSGTSRDSSCFVDILIKHGPSTDLEDLDFEAVDKEIEEDEAAQTAASTGAEPSQANKDDVVAPPA